MLGDGRVVLVEGRGEQEGRLLGEKIAIRGEDRSSLVTILERLRAGDLEE